MKRISAVVVSIGLLAAACQVSGAVENATSIPPEPVTSTTEAPAAPDRIVVSTSTGSVVVYDEEAVEVARFDPGVGSFFRQPTWLDAQTVVFSEVSESGNHSLTAGDASTGAIVWRAPMESSPFYFAPTPNGALAATTSLRNNPLGGLISELVDWTGRVTPLSMDSPFYTSWAPDGSQLAVNIPGRRLDVVTGPDTETIASPSGSFQAPAWVDRGIVTLRTVGGTQFLSTWADGSFTDLASVVGPATFVAANDRVAIRDSGEPDADGIRAGIRIQELPEIPGGILVVVDLETGDQQTVSKDPTGVFQWDSTGQRLLFTQGSIAGQSWHLWDDGKTTDLGMFAAQLQWVGDFVPFFDQYAQSVQLLSASRDQIAFPAVIEGEPVVVMLDIDDSAQVLVADAIWSSWAPEV